MRRTLVILALVLTLIGLVVYGEAYSADTAALRGEELAGGAFLLIAAGICWLIALFYHPSKRSKLA
jgi:hypothetical protein